MKKTIILCIVGVIILLLIGFLAWRYLKEPDEVLQWGMTKEQIKQYESELSGTLKIESAGTLLYSSRLFKRFQVAVEYEFSRGKLVRRKYMPLEKDLSSEESARDAQAIRKRLTSRHGKPVKKGTVETWTTNSTTISLRLWKTGAWTVEYQRK